MSSVSGHPSDILPANFTAKWRQMFHSTTKKRTSIYSVPVSPASPASSYESGLRQLSREDEAPTCEKLPTGAMGGEKSTNSQHDGKVKKSPNLNVNMDDEPCEVPGVPKGLINTLLKESVIARKQ